MWLHTVCVCSSGYMCCIQVLLIHVYVRVCMRVLAFPASAGLLKAENFVDQGTINGGGGGGGGVSGQMLQTGTKVTVR